MDSERLRHISFLFPRGDAETERFFVRFSALFHSLPGTIVQPGEVILTPPDPPDALPVTTVRFADVPMPTLHFDMAAPIDIIVGALAVTNQADRAATLLMQREERPTRVIEDDLGPYMVMESGDEDFDALLPVEELYQRLHGHLIRIDHTGVILPTASVTQTSWDMLIASLAVRSNLYPYPTGEPWPFILPATDAEFATDITRFTVRRAPKFELVSDLHVRHPLIQFDLETDLTRAEIEERFPEPYGTAIPGLAQYFRSVYLFHPWPRLTVRVDLRYRSDGPPSDWDTGEWLVTAGGRIR